MKRLLIALGTVVLMACAGLVWWSHGAFLQDPALVVQGLIFGWPATGQDGEEAAGISRYVADHFSFPELSKSMPNRPPVFGHPGGGGGLLGLRPHTLIVYSVTDRHQQDTILDLVRQYRQQKKLRRLPVACKYRRIQNSL